MAKLTLDGNQAVANIAYQLNEIIAIYPITPASAMGEWADEWSARGRPNLWGDVPRVVEMQGEGGAAGAIHGALAAGALATTFTSSQGLLLMLPEMYRIAGELTPAVFHVAARALACQALSIFGDHSDVMAARQTGFGLLCSNSPQEAQDLALIAHAASLEGRIPLLHFFDGFRTSHEFAKIEVLDDIMLSAMIRPEWIAAHRARALAPEHPHLRGSAQNPDVYFQARETVNPWYQRFPTIMQGAMARFATLTGRDYHLFDYVGSPKAEHVIVMMGSGAETAEETVDFLVRRGESVGLLKVRLYRPFSAEALVAALPASCKRLAVLDRTKEPGSDGEPLYKDVLVALAQHWSGTMPRVIGGRYGLASKEFTPGMVKSVFEELGCAKPRNPFTIGIHDDVGGTSLAWDPAFRTDAHARAFQAVFYGLGSDGTVSANKHSITIIGEHREGYAQGYFVYDSKKSGAVTVSHLRCGPDPIHSTYQIEADEADFVACHQAVFLERYPLLNKAKPGAVFLLNSPRPAQAVWPSLPEALQRQIVAKNIRLYAIDAYGVAERNGLGTHINTIMQVCFFAIAGILPQDEAISAIKRSVEESYGRKDLHQVERNFRAIDEALARLHLIEPGEPGSLPMKSWTSVPANESAFVREVTPELIAGRGEAVPVSRFSPDGSFPLGTSAYEKRNLAQQIPVWETALCTQCGKCPLVCPHAAIRAKILPEGRLADAPASFKHMPMLGKDFPAGLHIAYQVAPEDCTGCGLCVEICPIHDRDNAARKALNMAPQPFLLEQERKNWVFFLSLPEYERSALNATTLKGAMVFQPLFQFSGACEGCGQTPYIKLATQLFGDHMLVANATGCSSIYGGNLPTTPWCANAQGRGPAWANSLFEDNAEFGLGIRLAVEQQAEQAAALLGQLRERLPAGLADAILAADQSSEAGLQVQRVRVKALSEALAGVDDPRAARLLTLAGSLCRASVWLIGGDGWAYDIGYGGLDHVLASGKDLNILVLNNEVYGNTGGQTSKATPRGAVARFSVSGKPSAAKDLALLAMGYENVYVAQVAYGAKDVQTLRAFLEAEAHPGPSLILAYTPCIAHGVDLANNLRQQALAVQSGHWPLFRFDPKRIALGQNPMRLDSAEPSVPLRAFAETEARFAMLRQTRPEDAEHYLQKAQEDVLRRYRHYQQLAALDWNDKDAIAALKAKLESR